MNINLILNVTGPPSRIVPPLLLANRGRRAPLAVTSSGCGLPSARVSPALGSSQQSCCRRRGADASLTTGAPWSTFSRLICNARTSECLRARTRALLCVQVGVDYSCRGLLAGLRLLCIKLTASEMLGKKIQKQSLTFFFLLNVTLQV